MTSWHEFMDKRVEGLEPNVPWYLENKLEGYRFCQRNNFSTANVVRIFDEPDNIDLTGLDTEFVLKPTGQSSMKGVMLLSPVCGGYYESLHNQILTLEEIITYQDALYQETTSVENQIIIEEKFEDVGNFEIPRDFKAYAFRGKVALFLEIDRNTHPTSVAFFDGEFNPLEETKVEVNPKYITRADATPPAEAMDLLRVAVAVSEKLPTPFARIDLYSTTEGPKVGEITLTPGGFYYGVHYILSEQEQTRLGAMWHQAAKNMRL